MNINQKCGQKIKQARLLAGVSQEDLANLIKMTRATVISIEAGNYGIKLETLAKISKALNIEISLLTEGLGKKVKK